MKEMKEMKKTSLLVASIFFASLFLTGCQTLSPNQRSTISTTLGSITGALAGSQIGDGSGRLVAMAVGAAVGGLVGNQFAAYLNEREQKALAQTTQRALSFDDEEEGSLTWQSQERSGVAGQIYYGKVVGSHDQQAISHLSLSRGQALSSEEQALLARLPSSTVCRATRTSLLVEDRNVANGEIWCRTAEGNYRALNQMTA